MALTPKNKFQISFLDTSILVCTTLALTSFFFSRSQHQGTRITSATVAVPEVIWFPDVALARQKVLSFFAQALLLFEFCFGGVVTFVVSLTTVSVVYTKSLRSLVYLPFHYYSERLTSTKLANHMYASCAACVCNEAGNTKLYCFPSSLLSSSLRGSPSVPPVSLIITAPHKHKTGK